jgi:pimeloyl-ACP methyl ester carboxylesterase
MKRIFVVLCCTVLALYLGLCLMLFFTQRSLIYFPTERALVDPATDMTLSVADASLRLAVRIREGPNALIYFGGNAEDVSHSLGSFASAFPGHAIYMVHYRGYGGSSGKPSEDALHMDAQALYEKVSAEHSKIVVVGRSLGSGVAVRLAATRPVHRLVLVTPYDSIVNVAKRQFPFMPVSLLLLDRYESWRDAPRVQVPTLIVAAANDQVIPRESTAALFRAFLPGVARMKVIAGVGHNSISAAPGYLAAIQSGL